MFEDTRRPYSSRLTSPFRPAWIANRDDPLRFQISVLEAVPCLRAWAASLADSMPDPPLEALLAVLALLGPQIGIGLTRKGPVCFRERQVARPILPPTVPDQSPPPYPETDLVASRTGCCQVLPHRHARGWTAKAV